MKRAVLLGMVVLFMLGWVVTVQGLIEKPAEYRRLVQDAEAYEAEQIYVRAIESYKEALTYQPNSVDLKTRIALDYLALGDEASFVNRCNSINEEHRYPLQVVTLLSDHYINSRRNEKAIAVLQRAMKYHKNSPEIMERYDKLRYTYKEQYMNYDDIYPYRNDSAVVVQNGRYGLIGKNGKAIVKCQNDWMGAFSSDRTVMPVLWDGEFFFANSSGYRIEVPKDNQHVEALGILCNGAAPAKINGKYGYVNERFEELSPFQWDGATVIQNGFGAVCKGDKWALINKEYQLVTDYIYDDVRMDAYGYCSISGRAFVKGPDGYRMVNEKGEQVGDGIYQDAVPFQTKEPTAVQVGDKWGFVNLDGQMVIEPQYQDAGSFSGGLAPVKTVSKWGYIDQENQLVIAAEYLEARSFYKGVAPVKKGNSWTAIELNIK